MNRIDDRYDNVVNLDGSRYREGKEVKRARRGILYKLTPEVIGAGILILVFLYLLIIRPVNAPTARAGSRNPLFQRFNKGRNHAYSISPNAFKSRQQRRVERISAQRD